MTHTMSVNRKTQLGVESTAGTSVAANRVLEAFDFQLAVEADQQEFTGSGSKYVDEMLENTEWSSWKVTGKGDYNHLIYLVNSVYGTAAITSHGASSTAKDHKVTPPTRGAATYKTYTLQQGDSVRAQQAAYTAFHGFGYKFTRKGTFDITADAISQAIADAATLTASPTIQALAPIVPKHVNLYLDPTSAALGTTQIAIPLSFEYQRAGVYGALWALNRTNASFLDTVDLRPKVTGKIMMEADANGMTPLTYFQSGTTYYLRMDAQGVTIDVPNSIKNEWIHDMAIKFGKPDPFQDDQGVFAVAYPFTVVEDPAWSTGTAEMITLTNLLTTL